MAANDLNLLVIGDSPDHLAALKALLADAVPNASLVVALAGPQTVLEAREAEPDAILLDAHRPPADGFEMCRQLRADERLRHVPVIFLAEQGGARAQALELGAAAFLSKPVGGAEIAAQIRAIAEIAAPPVSGDTAELDRKLADCRRVEEALRESNKRMRAVAESARDAVLMMDPEGRVSFWNPAAERIFGYTGDEVMGRDLHGLLAPTRHHEAFDGGFAMFRRTGRGNALNATIELQACRKTGEELPIELSLSALHLEDGWHAVGIVRDITERKRAETTLKERNQYFETVLENAPIGFAVHTIQDGKAVFVGSRFEEIYGVPHGSLASAEDFFEKVYLDPNVRRQMRTRVMADLASGDPVRMRWEDIPITTAAGERKFVTATNIPIFNQNLMVSTVQDVTERKLAEEERAQLQLQLSQAQKMESVGRLAGGVAHDFNNLLTVINGYSQLLIRELNPLDPMRESVAEIHRAGERAAELTRQLLAFSRKQVLQPQFLDLNRIVNGMRSLLPRLIGEDIELRIDLKTEGGYVYADPHQLEQVLMNLVINARDAMPDGGTLTIRTSYAELDAGHSRAHPGVALGTYARLSVSDTGVGMDEETRRHIFEPFFTTKESGKGTGLGLSVVVGVVEQSGGHIEVESEVGTGTTFMIYLPLQEQPAIEDNALKATSVRGGSETVLLVEDQREVRELAARILTEYGYRVLKAEDAEAALALCNLERGRIHLLLTDVIMPKINGPELAARMQRLQPDIKVLFMSGYTGSAVEHHGLLDGAAQFLQKPFSPGGLATKVREVLGQSQSSGRILVADDEAAVRGFLRKVLVEEGYEVIEAVDGKQAVRQARVGQVDLVITDLVMPEQEGLETIQALRRQVPGLGIIAISGAFGGQFLHIAQGLGADAVLKKPVSAELLLASVADVLKRRR